MIATGFMSGEINLKARLEKQLPGELIEFMRLAGDLSRRKGFALYLVGGVVRDLLLERANYDLDLVVGGDAVALAGELAQIKKAELVTHPRFGTATVRWDGHSADLATARSESYASPGALPAVKAGSIRGDLFRRDFTINAMAVDLDPARYGALLDSFGGVEDLKNRLVRALHERSFTDDATRIWRAVRYEQRLGFTVESRTLQLLERDLPMLSTVSGDRIRHELELVLVEEKPERALYRAGELGVLEKLHPSLKADGWLAGKFVDARQKVLHGLPALDLYLALLTYPLSESEVDRLAGYLRLTREVAQVLRAVCDIKAELDLLAEPELTPGGIYALLHGQNQTALIAVSIATDSLVVKERLQLYLEKLRYVKPALTGADLTRMGFSGARIREILDMLRRARLDGGVKSRVDEERLVEGLAK